MQEQIENFMEFLMGIQKIMAVVKDGEDRVLIKDLTAKDLDDLNSQAELKRVCNCVPYNRIRMLTVVNRHTLRTLCP